MSYVLRHLLLFPASIPVYYTWSWSPELGDLYHSLLSLPSGPCLPSSGIWGPYCSCDISEHVGDGSYPTPISTAIAQPYEARRLGTHADYQRGDSEPQRSQNPQQYVGNGSLRPVDFPRGILHLEFGQ